MGRKKFFYIPILILFGLSVTAIVLHLSSLADIHGRMTRDAKLPFGYVNGRVFSVVPEIEAKGIRVGDRIEAFNGRIVGEGEAVFDEESEKMQSGVPVELTLTRKLPNGETERQDVTVVPVPVVRDLSFYSAAGTNILFVFVFPIFCILLGFWVIFIRPADPLAWILLFVLIGISSVGLEMYWDVKTFLGAYRIFGFSCWALAMMLFGIYFPERWSLDQKLPFLKWLLIIPLAFQLMLVAMEALNANTGINLFPYFGPLPRWYGRFGFWFNMLGIATFFTALAHKSWTTRSPDGRRRLRMILFGTSLAITPSFIIVLYRVIWNVKGAMSEIVPFWVAAISLLLMLMFPLTLAYVIVVQRAMDVRVVVRQGLQYALATNGVRILQLLLLLAVILGIIYVVRDNSENVSVQIAFVIAGLALLPLIDMAAKRLRIWIDKKFFREAYDAEQILTELSDDVRTIVETRSLFETVAAKISESLHVPQVSLLVKDGSEFVPAYSLGYDTAPPVRLKDQSMSIKKLSDNKAIILYDDMSEATSTPTVSLDEMEQLRELNSQVLLPLASKNELSGIISLSPKRSEEPYTANDLRLLRSVAAQAGLALENSKLSEAFAREAAQKERLNAELEIAREVQERLFPQEMPPVKGLEYYGACRPALGVGGDYFDFLTLPDDKFGIAVGDVSGKGIGASLMMASLQASLRGQALHSGDDLAALMTHINSLVYEASTSNRYATFFYAQYDRRSQTLSYVNGGHNPPFLIRGSGADTVVTRLEAGGPVVGMLPPMIVSYEQQTIGLEEGDLIVGFTDGISEAMNPAEEEWGEDALLAKLIEIRDLHVKEMLENIVDEADRFADGAKQHDDMTMVVVRVTGDQVTGS